MVIHVQKQPSGAPMFTDYLVFEGILLMISGKADYMDVHNSYAGLASMH